MTNIVHLIDNMEFMSGLPDNAFDLAIVDPPYGIGWDKEQEGMSAGIRKDGTKKKCKTWKSQEPKKYKKGNYDKEIPSEEYFKRLIKISKNQIIWGGQYFSKYLQPTGGWIVWDKKVTMTTLSNGEMAWTSILGHLEIFEYLWAGYRKQKKENRIHINQKPVDLYKWLLKNYAQPGQTIFDSHVGSGSIRIACHDMGFDFVGCENDPDYWQAQENRYKQHIEQGNLFDIGEIRDSIYKQEEIL